MKVTIDTKEDSHEDIQKVLHILTNLLEKKNFSTSSDPSSLPSTNTTNLMGMFDSPSDNSETKESATPMSMFANPETQNKEVSDTPPDFSSFLNLGNKEEEKKDEPKIEFF